MKIKNVKCDQFAGIKGKDLSFEDGLNIVTGANESGKSTLTDLIFHSLFKDAKLDGRSDTDFIDRYFPKAVSGPNVTTVDGTICFSTPEGEYTLTKEWEKGRGASKLRLPDGTVVRDDSEINKILAKELKHRSGVYREIVFSSQRRNATAVESIMKDSAAGTKEDLASTLNRVALETGGISIDKLEKGIKTKLDELKGRWDFINDAPEGGRKRASYENQWVNGAGSIVKAYYEVDKVRSLQSEAEKAERAVEAENTEIQRLKTDKENAKENREAFGKFKGILEKIKLLAQQRDSLRNNIDDQETASNNWPEYLTKIAKAKELNKKQKDAADHELYLKAKGFRDNLEETEKKLVTLKEVDSEDVSNLSKFISAKQKAESKLAGLNLAASIKQLGQDSVIVKSCATGEELDISSGEVDIKEAVDIVIPGILEMQLKPKGLNVDAVKSEMNRISEEIETILRKYDIKNPEELETMKQKYLSVKQDKANLELQLDTILNGRDWKELESANALVPEDIEPEAEIKAQIVSLCGTESLDGFIGGMDATIRNYAEKYKTPENLSKEIAENRSKLSDCENELASAGSIPDEYKQIDDLDAYDASLKSEEKDIEEQLETHRIKLNEEVRKLGEKTAEEYSDELLEKERQFEAKKAEYKHWENIQNAFDSLKTSAAGDPTGDIREKFKEYLSAVTNGRVDLNQMDEDLHVEIASGDNALTYDILSEGTKDTISLAFRLAMLEHLYPDGNGLAVFDDPFTDMDPKRVENACKLIEKFAENNQVIFVTCDDKYKTLMSGHIIDYR